MQRVSHVFRLVLKYAKFIMGTAVYWKGLYEDYEHIDRGRPAAADGQRRGQTPRPLLYQRYSPGSAGSAAFTPGTQPSESGCTVEVILKSTQRSGRLHRAWRPQRDSSASGCPVCSGVSSGVDCQFGALRVAPERPASARLGADSFLLRSCAEGSRWVQPSLVSRQTVGHEQPAGRREVLS